MQKNRRKKIKTIPSQSCDFTTLYFFLLFPPVRICLYWTFCWYSGVYERLCACPYVRCVCLARKAFWGGDIEVGNQMKWWNESWEDVGEECVKVLSWKWVWVWHGKAWQDHDAWQVCSKHSGRCVVSRAGRGSPGRGDSGEGARDQVISLSSGVCMWFWVWREALSRAVILFMS